jgi:WD40 repeat protein
MSTLLDFDNPWPGPDSFGTADAAFFLGRDGEIEQLLHLVQRTRCVILYGASGLGKTSLINAGLVPRFPRDELFPVPIRISYVAGSPPVAEQLQAKIVASRPDGMPKPDPKQTAWEYLHRRNEPIEGAQPVFIFDQFEELFTIGAGTEQAAQLVEELKGLIEETPPLSVRQDLDLHPEKARELSFQRNDSRVLISIREDFLHGLESLRSQIPAIIHNRYRIGHLNGETAMEVVTQRRRATANAKGIDSAPARPPLVDEGVAELIVRTVAPSNQDERPLDGLEVEPALLSILCSELARRRKPGTLITRDLVTGSRADIIAGFYDRALANVPPSVRTFVEDQLVTATGFRTSAVVTEALAVSEFTSDLLEELVKKRLLRVLDRHNGKWIEITHDILAEIAVRSRTIRQARQREEEREDEAMLAREAKERRRVRRVVVALASLLLALGVMGWFSVVQRRARNSIKELLAQREDALRVAAQARRALRGQFIDTSLGQGNYREALAQLAAAVEDDPSATRARALLADLLLRRNWPLPVPPLFPQGPFTHLACDSGGARCAAALRDGRVFVRGNLSRDLATGQQGYAILKMSTDGTRLLFVPQLPGEGIQWTFRRSGVEEFRFKVAARLGTLSASDDDQVVLLPNGQGVTVWQLGARRSFDVQVHLYPPLAVLSPDGRWFAYQNFERSVIVADAHDGAHDAEFAVSKRPTKLRIDPTSETLWVAQTDGTLTRWRLPRGGKVQPNLRAQRAVSGMTFDYKGNLLALALEGGGVELWRAPWSSSTTLMGSSGGVMNLAFSPEGDWLSAAGRDGIIRAWSSTGAALTEPIQQDTLVFACPLRDQSLVSVSLDGKSASWSIRGRRGPAVYELHEAVRRSWFLSEQAFYAQGAGEGLEQSSRSSRREEVVPGRVFARDRRHTLTCYIEGCYLKQGIPSGKNPDPDETRLPSETPEGRSFSRDGKRLFIVSGGRAQLWDTETHAAIGKAIENVSGFWLNDDGKIVAMERNDTGVALGEVGADGALNKLADIEAGNVFRVVFDRRAEQLALITENKARVWSLRTRQYVGQKIVHHGPILDADFSPDGRWLATASEDKTARIWEASSGLPASDWFEHDESVVAVDFSPSGRRMLTASGNRVRVWDVLGGADVTPGDAPRLAHLAEMVGGFRIDPNTNEMVPAPERHDVEKDLRDEVAFRCPQGGGPSGKCSSAVDDLIRAMLGGEPAAPATAAP